MLLQVVDYLFLQRFLGNVVTRYKKDQICIDIFQNHSAILVQGTRFLIFIKRISRLGHYHEFPKAIGVYLKKS